MIQEFKIKGENICRLTRKKCNKWIICKYCGVRLNYMLKKKEKINND